MKKADAIALLVGIGSGATATHVGVITRQLLEMPLRRLDRPSDEGLSRLRNSRYGFYNFRRDHTFLRA
jgi:hypothetical protein